MLHPLRRGGVQKVMLNEGEGRGLTKRKSSKLYDFREKFRKNNQVF